MREDFTDVTSGASSTAPVLPVSDFERAYAFVLSLELGWWAGNRPSDPNPTLNGVTQKTYTRWRASMGKAPRSVREMEPDEQDAIYLQFWDECRAGALDWPLCVVHFDTAFNSGAGQARVLLKRSNYDVQTYFAERLIFYGQLILEHPEMAPNALGWRNRVAKLRAFIQGPL